MNEVSGKANEFLLVVLDHQGIPRSRVVEGLPIGLEELEQTARRVDWDLHAELLDRVEKLIGGSEVLERLAPGPMFEAPHLGPIRAIAGLVVTGEHLYRMMARWVGPTYFTHIAYSYEELGAGRLRFTVDLPESYRGSAPYFRLVRALLVQMPILIGLGEAEVEAELGTHRGVYTVRPPRRRSLRFALSTLFGRKREVPDVVGEVLAQNARDHNQELRRAELSLGEERRTLDILGQTLVAQFEQGGLGEGLLDALCAHFSWTGASLWVAGEANTLDLLCVSGGRGEGNPRGHLLTVAGRTVGRLDVWGVEPATDPHGDELFARMLPWVAVAVANARSTVNGAHDEFRWLGDSEKELFVIVDADARVRYAGPSAERVLGRSQADLVDMDLSELVHPDDLERLGSEFLAFGEKPGSTTIAAARLRHADGSWRILEGVGIKVQGEQGRPVFMFSTSDVSDRYRTH